MAERGIPTDLPGRKIVMFLIDRLYDLLNEIAGEPAQSGVWVVDCRSAMPALSDWAYEIHGSSGGFAKVAARFRAVLDNCVASGSA